MTKALNRLGVVSVSHVTFSSNYELVRTHRTFSIPGVKSRDPQTFITTKTKLVEQFWSHVTFLTLTMLGALTSYQVPQSPYPPNAKAQSGASI